MQCFDTFSGFLHKLYAATMDGKGREGTHNFFSRRGQGRWHRGQLSPATPLALPVVDYCNSVNNLVWCKLNTVINYF